jgi:predicted transcriptional regulator
MSTRYSAVSSLPPQVTNRALKELQRERAQDSARGRIKEKSNAGTTLHTRRSEKPKSMARQAEHSVNLEREGHRWLSSDLTARDLMQSCEATLRPEDSIERAARLMNETENVAIPVVDGAGRLIGIVSPRDITMRLIALGASIPHTQVSDCMTAEVFACSADNSLESCVSAMCWHQVKRIPIVDDEHKVLGTISQRDLAQYLCEHSDQVEPSEMVDILWALAS